MGYLDYRKTNPIYSPGLSTYNGNVTVGANGTDGTSLYYADRTLSEGNNMESFNQRIENGISFDGSSTKITYKKGDIIIDDTWNVYIIEESGGVLYIGLQSIGNIIDVSKIAKKEFNIEHGEFSSESTNFIFQGLDASLGFIETLPSDGSQNLDARDAYIQQANITTGEVTLWKIQNE